MFQMMLCGKSMPSCVQCLSLLSNLILIMLIVCYSCPTYNNLPQNCKLEKKAGQCCPTVQCVNGYFLTSSLTPSTIGSGGAINVTNPAPGVVYFLRHLATF